MLQRVSFSTTPASNCFNSIGIDLKFSENIWRWRSSHSRAWEGLTTVGVCSSSIIPIAINTHDCSMAVNAHARLARTSAPPTNSSPPGFSMGRPAWWMRPSPPSRFRHLRRLTSRFIRHISGPSMSLRECSTYSSWKEQNCAGAYFRIPDTGELARAFWNGKFYCKHSRPSRPVNFRYLPEVLRRTAILTRRHRWSSTGPDEPEGTWKRHYYR